MSGEFPNPAVSSAADIRKAAKPVAATRQDEGRKSGASKGGKTAGRGRPIASGESFPKGKRDEAARTRAVAAKAVGVDQATVSRFLQEMSETRLGGKATKSANHDDGFEPVVPIGDRIANPRFPEANTQFRGIVATDVADSPS
jgi:hypothetical protein